MFQFLRVTFGPQLMRGQHASFLTVGLALAALLGACARQGQGEPCDTQGNDCQSPLTCLPIPGSTNLGTCCMANSRCGSSQNGFMLIQNGTNATTDAAAGSLDDATSADAWEATTDAFVDDANADARTTNDASDDAQTATDALGDAGGGG